MAICYEHSVDVKSPPEESFAFLDDLPRTPEWLKPCTSITKLSPGPNAVGDRLKYTHQQGGRAGIMDGEIEERVPNQKLKCRYYDKMMDVVVDFTVAPLPQGSRLTHVITITPKTFLAKLISPLIRLSLPRQTQDAMASLKVLLEHQDK